MNPETRLVWHPLRDLLNKLREARLQAGLSAPHYDRLETVTGDTPDLSWAHAGREGHIELKYRADWPVRPTTPVVIETVTAGQRLWWRQRSEAGGHVRVLVRIGLDYVLLEGRLAALRLGRMDRAELEEHNLLSNSRRLDLEEVLRP